MSNESFGMTVEEMNRKNNKEAVENLSAVQKERQDRHESMGNALSRAFSKDYDTAKLTATGNALLSGELNASNFEPEKAVEFSAECRTAIESLEKKLFKERTTAGLMLHQGKMDAYKSKMQEIDDVKSQIQLYKTFV